MKCGWELYGNSKNIGIIKGNNKVEFNKFINKPKLSLFYIYLKSKTEISKEKALINVDENKIEKNPPNVKKIYDAVAHDIFGHMV